MNVCVSPVVTLTVNKGVKLGPGKRSAEDAASLFRHSKLVQADAISNILKARQEAMAVFATKENVMYTLCFSSTSSLLLSASEREGGGGGGGGGGRRERQVEMNLGRKKRQRCFRAQELCESRGGRPGLPVPNIPYGLCRRKATLNLNSDVSF